MVTFCFDGTSTPCRPTILVTKLVIESVSKVYPLFLPTANTNAEISLFYLECKPIQIEVFTKKSSESSNDSTDNYARCQRRPAVRGLLVDKNDLETSERSA